MALTQHYTFQGKEFQVWNEEQLGSINREALKKRAMDIRSFVGAERLPAMPHHPEGLTQWILEVQGMLMKSCGDDDDSSHGSPGAIHDVGAGSPAPVRGASSGAAGHSMRSGSAVAAALHGDGMDAPVVQRSRGEARPLTPTSMAAASDSQQAYLDASSAARASRERNRGGGIF